MGGLARCRARGSLWYARRANGRSLGGRHHRRPLFRAGRRPVRLHSGAVDQGDLWRVGAGDEGGEDPRPEAALAPAVPSVEDRRVRPVFRRQGAPSAAFAEAVHDAADHPPVVHAPRSRVHHRQMRLDRRPLHVAQPEQARHGPSPAVWQGEPSRRTYVNWVQTLIEQEHGVLAGADQFANLEQVGVHHGGVAERQDQGRALALLRADGVEGVDRGIALVLGRGGPGLVASLTADDAVLLADAGALGEPDLCRVEADAFALPASVAEEFF